MVRNILCCTVGGSHQPIITSIKQLRPDYICFFCTAGKAGSDKQIIGEGKIIKARHSDEKATLPNIPVQLGLPAETYEVVEVPHDELDAAYLVMTHTLQKLSGRHADENLYADYTGGTKTMTAALVLAALEHNVELHAVIGHRTDLEKVADGTEWGFPASVEQIRFEREMRQQMVAWRAFAYAQASQGLANLRSPVKIELRDRFLLAKTLSDAFDAWDRFDHEKARELLSACRNSAGARYADYFKTLTALTGNKEKQVPALLQDLLLNAERRAAQGRYDDAVARIYRLIEWTAQWVLRRECGVDTADLPETFIPSGMDIHKNFTGKIQAPLYKSWQLVGKKVKSPAAEYMKNHGEDLRGILAYRNNSILAHGTVPIDEAAWGKMSANLEQKFLPYFQEELRKAGLKKSAPQLPTDYDWLLGISDK
jgi:CRISPR-associated protein (TIGR02710 family)